MNVRCFSALQRAEIAEIRPSPPQNARHQERFSALQRAEIAEIRNTQLRLDARLHVSVLFNEPKLLKSSAPQRSAGSGTSFSALQRAEIAEMLPMSSG